MCSVVRVSARRTFAAAAHKQAPAIGVRAYVVIDFRIVNDSMYIQLCARMRSLLLSLSLSLSLSFFLSLSLSYSVPTVHQS